ncbi:MAG TPA: NUDIX domain-containing protein, partial [Kofleriaceae bacterium]|nr:NUDIX domain-containing protein [Kofleriaceae bacterium]
MHDAIPRSSCAPGGGVSEPRARKLVVAGLIVGDDRRILITQRRADQSLPLQWEFPGGKVEPGEAPEA